ncbi:putative nesprin-1 isoform X3 [Apostichopus japonicus]|uniref:Putative nesprin-1 isoform X3 n=1 Tax=Stichopus japonicus TaxID=307972 RepID=A0A2G8KXI3_STIJA|nr:putative nesprin-1 isoform X3 [Apostichopus japonicus]
MRVYNPDTNEMTKGVPAGSWLEKQETPLSKTDSVALEVQMEKEPASAEEEEDVPVRQQLVTEMGPAYTLSPLGGDGVAGDDSPDVDYVLCQETSPRDSPKVTGLKAAPSTEEPVTISDPHTGEVFVAEPCGDPEQLKSGLTAYLPGEEEKEGVVKVFDPRKAELAEAVPTESCKEKLSAAPSQREIAEKPMEEEPMDVSDRDKTEEAPVTRQIVTDQGPAYTLRKAGQDGVACKDSPDVDYVLSKQTSGAETPNVTGVRAVAKPQPLLVSDPQTGEVFLAEPTEDPEEISQGKIAFVPDDASKTIASRSTIQRRDK